MTGAQLKILGNLSFSLQLCHLCTVFAFVTVACISMFMFVCNNLSPDLVSLANIHATSTKSEL